MSGIKLHKTKGLNPYMTICPRCGEDGDELILIGSATGVYKCSECNMISYGGKPKQNICPNCKAKYSYNKIRDLDEYEKIPASEPCSKCQKELEKHKAEVAAGGVYWRCKDCGSKGVIIATSNYAKAVRDQHELHNGEPCGVKFSDKDCPVCSVIAMEAKTNE